MHPSRKKPLDRFTKPNRQYLLFYWKFKDITSTDVNTHNQIQEVNVRFCHATIAKFSLRCGSENTSLLCACESCGRYVQQKNFRISVTTTINNEIHSWQTICPRAATSRKRNTLALISPIIRQASLQWLQSQSQRKYAARKKQTGLSLRNDYDCI